jgi:predicted dehydrogenase
MGEPLKSAVIGLGLLGHSHASYLQKSSATSLVAGAEIREQAASEAETKFGIKVYKDYRDMLASESPDMAVVCTQDPLHRDPVVACAEAGVPYIVVEKPLATTVEDGQAMLDACSKAQSKLWVHLANRVVPLDIATRYIVHEGLLGRPIYGEARLDDNISVPLRLWGDRSREWAEAVYAISQHEVLGFSPDLFDAYLFFDNGAKFRVKAEWIRYMQPLVEYYICVNGDKGTVFYNKIPGFNVKEHSLQANFASGVGADELLRHQAALLKRGVSAHVAMYQPQKSVGGEIMPSLVMDVAQPPATHLMDHILASIAEAKPVPSTWEGNGTLPTGEEGLKQTRIVCAILESARTRREVAVG